jgi:hypothetical protein
MRYPIRKSADAAISLPQELAAALGEPIEADAIPLGCGLLVQPTSADVRMGASAGDLAAIEAYRARRRSGLGFTPEEELELKAASKMADRHERDQILADFPAGDLPA